jgi:hypothetical protein
MAKPTNKSNNSSNKGAPKNAAAGKAAPAKVVGRTDVRNSPIPRPASPAAKTGVAAAAPAPRVVSHDQIAVRAYEIWASGQGGSEFDNWVRAERELRNA